MSSFAQLSAKDLRHAATLKEKIDSLQRELEKLLGRPDESAGSTIAKPGRKKRRKMSAEARAKIAAAQKKRWAKQKAGKK